MLSSTSHLHTKRRNTSKKCIALRYEEIEGKEENLNKAFDILFEIILKNK